MQTIADVMTRDVAVLAPFESIQSAAQLMDELNVGAVPVCDGQRLVGVITDRDIAVRAVASGLQPDTPIADAMSEPVHWCYEDQPLSELMDQMREAQLRRIPVVDHDKHLVGIISLGDLVTRGDRDASAETLQQISTPSQPDRPRAH
jgi:CBS domain-containing protein